MSDETTWRQRVRDWRRSGLTSTVFVEGSGYSASALRYWAKRLDGEAAPTRASSGSVRLARVVSSTPEAAWSAAVVIELGRARVAVASGVDAATLRTVLEVLGELELR